MSHVYYRPNFPRCTTHSSSLLTLSWPSTSFGYKVTDRYCHQWWSLESADDSFYHQPPHPSLSTCHSSHFTQVTSRHLFLLICWITTLITPSVFHSRLEAYFFRFCWFNCFDFNFHLYADGSGGGRVFTGIWLSVCLSVCLSFHTIPHKLMQLGSSDST